MPTYFFHCVGNERDTDKIGSELPGDEAAHLETIIYAGEVLKHSPQQLWNSGQWRVEVADTRGALLFTVITLAIDAPGPANLTARPFVRSND